MLWHLNYFAQYYFLAVFHWPSKTPHVIAQRMLGRYLSFWPKKINIAILSKVVQDVMNKHWYVDNICIFISIIIVTLSRSIYSNPLVSSKTPHAGILPCYYSINIKWQCFQFNYYYSVLFSTFKTNGDEALIWCEAKI